MNKRIFLKSVSRAINKSIISISLGILMAGTANAGGLQDQMDQLFDGMTNTTMPGVYQSQRRGVLSGGRVTAKNKIFDESLISLSPPSFKAGCGGVDLYGGSLSFVNSDQIVQLLRSVAANAKGYAFQIALETVCPSCATNMENMQKKIQELNQYLGNSCQLAQGIVNDATSGLDIKGKTDASIKSTITGVYDDVFAAESQSAGKSPQQAIKDANPAEYKKLIGNIVWLQLNSNKVTTWFKYGDSSMLEAIMSMTGTVIIGDLVKDPNSSASSTNTTNPITYLEGNKIQLADLMAGGELTIYSCQSDTELCLTAGQSANGFKSVQLVGLRQQILEMLLGSSNGSSVGIINKMINDLSVNEEEQAFLAALPGGAGGMINQLTKVSPDMTETFAKHVADALAAQMLYDFATQFYRVARLSLANSQNAYKSEAMKILGKSERAIFDEFGLIVQRTGKISDIIQYYDKIMSTAHKQKIELASRTEAKQE